MGKKLLIVRHGEADSSFYEGDFQRKLTQKGRRKSIETAEKLLQKDEVPALLMSSTAHRALSTAQLFANTWNIPTDSILQQSSIYEASIADLLQIIQGIDNSYNFVAIFGHNPGFTELINLLTGKLLFDLPTSGAALISFEISDWKEIEIGGKLTLMI